MAATDAYPLRIYCICGQKMKASQGMLGRSGKCVACRQKLRIPRLEELPDGTTEVDLTEMPQFLRKGKADVDDGAAPEGLPEPSHPASLLEADDETGLRKEVAPAVLEPLRILASMEHRVRHRLARAEAAAEDSPEAVELRQTLEDVQDAREQLDDLLRQRLMETSVELTATQDRVAGLTLAARTGEASLNEFRQQVARHRRRRDCLERRQALLRGWLAVRNPHDAGGYVRIPLDAQPVVVDRIDFPDEPGEHCTLLDWWVRELHDALKVREAARAEKQETAKRRNRRDVDRVELGHLLATATAALARAEARLRFCRERLSTLEDDIAKDLQTAESVADLLRERRTPTEAVTALATGGTESALEVWRAGLRSDSARVRRALQATDARSVPLASSRLQPDRHNSAYLRNVVDAWLAWGAGILAALALLLPAFGQVSPLALVRDLRTAAPEVHWVATIPVAAAVASALIACVPGSAARGLGYLSVWLLSGFGAVLLVHEGAQGFSPLAEPMRVAVSQPGQPGVLALLVAHGLLGAAAVYALRRRPRLWAGEGVAIVALVVWTSAVGSDFLGYTRPNPVVSDAAQFDAATGQFDYSVWVANEGVREMALSSLRSHERVFAYSLERRGPEGGWEDAGLPRGIEADGARSVVRGSGLPDIRIRPGERAVLHYRLEPGNYRVVLNGGPAREMTLRPPDAPDVSEPPTELQAEPPPPPLDPGASTEMPDAATAAEGGDLEPNSEQNEDGGSGPGPAGADRTPDWTAPGAEVKLRGILATPDRNPRFMIDVYLADGRVRSRLLFLGATVHDTWYVAEFNQATRSVTLSNGQRFLVLRMEERLPLDEDLGVAGDAGDQSGAP